MTLLDVDFPRVLHVRCSAPIYALKHDARSMFAMFAFAATLIRLIFTYAAKAQMIRSSAQHFAHAAQPHDEC